MARPGRSGEWGRVSRNVGLVLWLFLLLLVAVGGWWSCGGGGVSIAYRAVKTARAGVVGPMH